MLFFEQVIQSTYLMWRISLLIAQRKLYCIKTKFNFKASVMRYSYDSHFKQ